MPVLSRPAYRLELSATFFFSIAIAAVEGGIVSVFTKNTFSGIVPPERLNLMVGLVQAAPELSNILSFVWASRAAGKPKIPFINGLQISVLVMILAGLAVPRAEWGLYVFVAIVILSRVCWSGIVTLRPTVWRCNYSRRDRARIVGKFSTVQVVTISIVGLILGSALDWDARSYLWMAPVGCLFGLGAFFAYRRVPVRGEKKILADEAAAKAESAALHGSASLFRGPGTVIRVLRQDPRFAQFMLWMFVLGLGNLMLAAILAIVLHDRFGLGYLAGIAITTSIPAGVMVLAIPLWARLLDRAHVVKFRSIHSWAFVLSTGMIFLASLLNRVELMYLGAVLQGIGFGGGTLAWNLGHHDFSPPSQTSQYMAVHVTLNGVRGLIAPFAAVGLYQFLKSSGITPLGLDPASLVFLVALLCCIGGAIGFGLLRWRMAETVRKFSRSAQ
jgi:MFS family permease